MLKFLLILVILIAAVACSDPAPTPEAAATPTPQSIAATSPPPANNPKPTATTAPTETPASSPTREPQAPKLLTALNVEDTQAVASQLSDAELECIGGNPGRLAKLLDGEGSPTEEHQTIACLDDHTLEEIFLGVFLPNAGTLEPESSDCLRAAFLVIRPRAIITGESARGGYIVVLAAIAACLNEQEWSAAAHQLEMDQEERDVTLCLMAVLGGPAELVTATIDWSERRGAEEETALFQAGLECRMEPTPEPAATQEPAAATPTPESTATTVAPTQTPEPATPTPTPPTPASTSAPEPTRAAPTPVSTTMTTLVITVASIPDGIPEYDRNDWKHWTDEDGDCQDARQEVLIAESLEPVEYETDRQCRVESGRWWAPHLSHHLGNPRHIDVDHHVPLLNAHLSGGWAWDAERKEQYANYLDDDAHLVAISARHNRSKGARGPEEWAPPDNSLWCDYALDWAEIKQRWGLTMTPVESEIVMDMLGTCENPPDFEVETRDVMEVNVGEHKPTAEPEGTVYGNCEDAVAAGEVRVKGSRGGGQGFPGAMVPSARGWGRGRYSV